MSRIGAPERLRGPKLPDAAAAGRLAAWAFPVSIATNLLALVQPVFMLHVYDFVLPSQSLSTLGYLTLIAVFLIGVLGALEYLRSRILGDLAWEVDRQLRAPAFLGAYQAGLQSGRAGRSVFGQDLESVKALISGPATTAVMDLPWTPIFILALFLLSPWLGALSLLFALLVLAAAIANEFTVRGYVSEGYQRQLRATQLAEDMFTATDAVQSMGMRARVLAGWADVSREQAAYARAAAARNGLWTALVRALRYSLQVLTLAAAAWLVLADQLSAGAMIAASIIGARALAPIDQAVAGWRSIVTGRVAWLRLGETVAMADALAARKTELPAAAGRLAAENVAVAGADNRALIQGVSFEAPAGAFIGLVGPSGSGKTTLARAIAGAVPPALGVMRMDGADYRAWEPGALGAQIGFLPQTVQLLGGTVAQNIRRFGPADDAGVVAAAQRAGAHDMIMRLPQGYDTPAGDAGARLSGGQRARVGLARALYGDPALVVLDEPFAHLDFEGEQGLAAALRSLRKAGRTVVMVAHSPAQVRHFDLIGVVQGGRLTAFGKAADILKTLNVQRAPAPAAGSAGPVVAEGGAP